MFYKTCQQYASIAMITQKHFYIQTLIRYMTIDIGVPTNYIYIVGALQMKGKTLLQSSSAQYWSRHTDKQS